MLHLDRNIFNSILVLGPTASGKTKLAVQLAHEQNGCVLSADSRQVYKHLDIGTGKDLEEYIIDNKQIPYQLIDIADLGTKYNLSNYINDFANAWQGCEAAKQLPIVCGGTGLYLDAILKGHNYAHVPVDAAFRKKLESMSKQELLAYYHKLPQTSYHTLADISTDRRLIRAIEIVAYLQYNIIEPTSFPEVKPYIIGINKTVELRREKIKTRLIYRLQNGLIDEVRSLLQQGLTTEYLIKLGLEYKYITLYILGELDYAEMEEQLYNHICQFAKRQMTWFRKMEREGCVIHWTPSF
ncbi:MAG: tRNA (adenosine(37)-N6)-dimethylallyltransferase MiaA [Bacteroidota bacterium]|nr:tRNA (adenosine(37)-N6)-dimethylallyltransferase MiaA [Bacteroidota bacterium]